MDTAQSEVVQITLPADWVQRIKVRVTDRGQPTTADYILRLIAEDIEPRYVDEETERLIIEGLDSGPGVPADAAFFVGLRRETEEAIRKARA